MTDISNIVSPDAPVTVNEKGGAQSEVNVRFDLIDGKALFEMAKVLDHGAKKYGANNWRLIPVEDHLNHLLMHVYAYLAGDSTDDHLSHALCRATFAVGVRLAEEDTKKEDPNQGNLFDHEYVRYSQAEVEEIDRNARAFGWQIGSGKSIMVGGTLCTTDDNPFLSPNWREEIFGPVEEHKKIIKVMKTGG